MMRVIRLLAGMLDQLPYVDTSPDPLDNFLLAMRRQTMPSVEKL